MNDFAMHYGHWGWVLVMVLLPPGFSTALPPHAAGVSGRAPAWCKRSSSRYTPRCMASR